MLVVLLWRCRRRRVSRALLGCLAVVLGLSAVAALLRRRRRRDRFAPPRRHRPPRGGRRPPARQRIPSTIYRRPDPMIYSQHYLMAQGVAVTWDNPDIRLEQNGTPVPSSALAPATDYEIVARVWNGSPDAPAVGLPVRVSYLEFGVGTVSHSIGERHVDLPVKGAVGLPVEARIPWTTPAAPGHYCLQVALLWPDDANPANNLGQENTDVKPLSSPARFLVPVRNDAALRRRLLLEVDAYRPRPAPCPPEEEPGAPPPGPRERAERRRRARARHARGGHPVPEGWTVAVEPPGLTLAPGEGAEVQVEVTAPDRFSGRQAFNLNALAEDELVGGVTLIVEGET
jgi:hypothetical protein